MTSILAIESSCDETSASVCVDGKIYSNIIASQAVHEQYGGVVPELASRAHMQNIVPVVEAAILEANLRLSAAGELPILQNDLSAIAFTQAPGLIGSLLVGAQFAKSLALALNKPLVQVHHMQAHVLSNLIPERKPPFPFLCLTVSGGHTQIVLCKSPLDLKVIGETIDDAAGEAFDKCAKLLGLPYPGGPLIDRYAAAGDPLKFKFAQPRVDGLNFSFSGLKTSVLYFLRDKEKEQEDFVANNMADICASLQHAIITILLRNIKKAVEHTGITEICMAGGVSANSGLREKLIKFGESNRCNIYIPPFEYCTDNAAMIAITGYYKLLAGETVDLSVSPSARAHW